MTSLLRLGCFRSWWRVPCAVSRDRQQLRQRSHSWPRRGPGSAVCAGVGEESVLADAVAPMGDGRLPSRRRGLPGLDGVAGYTLQITLTSAGIRTWRWDWGLLGFQFPRLKLTVQVLSITNSGGGGTFRCRLAAGLLYVPLGGNGAGRSAPTSICFDDAAGGLWHGANGRSYCGGPTMDCCWRGADAGQARAGVGVATALQMTFTFVWSVRWVLFRARRGRGGAGVCGAGRRQRLGRRRGRGRGGA